MELQKEDIKRFLNEKPGYLKEGATRLQERLEKQGFVVSTEDCQEALSECRAEQNSSEKIVREAINDEVPSNFELVSKWQSANGEWLESYKRKKEEVGEGWEVFKNSLIESLEDIKIPSYEKKHSKGNYAVEISLPDLHFGKGNIKTLKDNFFKTIKNLLDDIDISKVDKFILPIGNDGMNSEGLRSTTTSGTPQFDSAPWYETFSAYVSSIIEAVTFLNKIAPVQVVVVQGNHDWERMFYAGDVIKAWFRNESTVVVDNAPEPRKYVKYGKCLIMYTHGDKEKTADMPLIMATEMPLLFAETKHREVHCGHLHKEMLNEFRGIKVRFMPSICTTDDWHKQMGYDSYRCAQALIWDKEKGLRGFVQDNL